MTIDETDDIVKHLKRVSQVQHQSIALKYTALANAEHLLRSLSKTMQLFYKDKATNDGSKVYINRHALLSEDIMTIADDLKHYLE